MRIYFVFLDSYFKDEHARAHVCSLAILTLVSDTQKRVRSAIKLKIVKRSAELFNENQNQLSAQGFLQVLTIK